MEREEKEIQILSRVRELMFRQGIKSLTMDDIAQQLGVSKKTLYQVVENKADLVHKVITLTLEESRQGVEVMEGKHANAIEETLHIYKYHNEVSKHINPGLLTDLKKHYRDTYEEITRFQGGFVMESVKKNIERGITEGIFRKDIDPEIIARLYTSRELGAFNSEVFPPDKFSASEILKEMFFYHFRGIASEKGLTFLDTVSFEL